MTDQGQVPLSLLLPISSPLSCKAYVRRFLSPMTTGANGNPDTYINIYPDTSTPGSFIDPSSTYIMGDLAITNPNPYIDFMDIGPEGIGASLIQEWRVYNQGSILEEILEYPTVCSAMANISGEYDSEVSMYFSNKLKNNFSDECHKNFIKPPMCDSNGNIMYGLNPYGLGYDPADSMTSAYVNVFSTGQAALMQPIGTTGISHIYQYSSVVTTTLPNTYAGSYPFINTTNSTTLPSWAGAVAITPMDWPDMYSPTMSDPISVAAAYVKENGTPNKPQIMANLCNVKCFPIGMIPGSSSYNTAAYGSGILGKISNGPAATYVVSTGVATAAAAAANYIAPAARTVVYRFCFKPLSGIFGMMAPKMLATCLLAPQQMYINLHLSPSANIFKVSADPCRRITGTARDYVRNMGTQQGKTFGQSVYTLSLTDPTLTIYNTLTSSYAPGYAPFHSIPAGGASIQPYAAGLNTTFSPAAACGRCTYTTPSDTPIFVGVGEIATTTGILTLSAATLGSITNIPQGSKISGTNIVAGTIVGAQTITGTADDGTYYTSTVTAAASGAVTIYGPASGFILPATPQYALVNNAWQIKQLNAADTTSYVNYINENQAFYGTYLKASKPQSARIFQFTNVLGTSQTVFTNANRGESYPSVMQPSYTITNINLVGNQIILPNEITEKVIDQAMQNQFNVHTNSIRTYNVGINTNATQTIILPLKVAQAKRLFCCFQPNQVRTGSQAYYYNSNCGYNIFANIDSGTGNTFANIAGGYIGNASGVGKAYNAGAGTAGALYGVGYSNTLNYIPTATDNTQNISVQLRIGNEFYPPQPLQTMEEISVEMCKTLEGWDNPSAKYELDSKIISIPGSATGTTAFASGAGSATAFYDCLQPGKYTTAFVSQDLLDDQTITSNYDFAPLYSCNFAADMGVAATYGITTVAAATKASSLNGYNWLCPRGNCVPGMFQSPSSRFLLGFNLSSFKSSDGVDGGTYLGNNTITLQLGGAVGLGSAINNNWRLVCIVPHRAVMRYQSGGQIIWNY